MEPWLPDLARDRIEVMQADAAAHHDARRARAHRRATRQAERVERKMRRLAQAAQRLHARVAELEGD